MTVNTGNLFLHQQEKDMVNSLTRPVTMFCVTWVLLGTHTTLSARDTLQADQQSTPVEAPQTRRGITLPEFGHIDAAAILGADELFVVIFDKYPVSPGHALIIPRRAAPGFQDLTTDEKARLIKWIDWTQRQLTATLKPKPDAFNFGLNDGVAAGQTKHQFHFHIIPRYIGDVPDPRGGVRAVIPKKSNYWDQVQPTKR